MTQSAIEKHNRGRIKKPPCQRQGGFGNNQARLLDRQCQFLPELVTDGVLDIDKDRHSVGGGRGVVGQGHDGCRIEINRKDDCLAVGRRYTTGVGVGGSTIEPSPDGACAYAVIRVL